jgi:hypothetical protein
MDKLVGNLQKEKLGLMNTYLRTDSGLLIPQPNYFFSDSCAYAIGNIRCCVSCAEESIELGSLADISPENLKHYKGVSRIGSKKNYDKDVKSCKCLIDEVLAIASPKDSFGLVKVKFKGRFDDEYISFFNAVNLKTLFEKVSKQHFDYERKTATGSLDSLLAFWEKIRGEYNEFSDREFEKSQVLK